MYQTSFRPNEVDAGELDTLVQWIARKTGSPVKVESLIVVSTDNVEVSNMLDALRDAMKKAAPTSTKVERRNGHRKAKKQKADRQKKEPTRGPHVRSIKVMSTGEMISRFELNRRLLEHTIKPGEKVHSPKYGVMIVQKAESDSVPHTLVNEAGEPV